MCEYRILIPSYQRADTQSTVELLAGAYGRDEIILSTQTKEDYEQYRAKWRSKATVIYREGHSVGDNRNTLLRWCEENGVKQAIMLDDDISGMQMYNKEVLKDGQSVRKLFETCFKIAQQCKATVFGSYPVSNPLMMSSTVTVNNIMIGTFLGILDTSLRFDARYRVKEDYELCLRVMSQGGNVLRFNNMAPRARHKSQGGCLADFNDVSRYPIYAQMLMEQYPQYVKANQSKVGEVRYVGPSKVIKIR
jgi:hypothetical protein